VDRPAWRHTGGAGVRTNRRLVRGRDSRRYC
jgi:hypothetical protein